MMNGSICAHFVTDMHQHTFAHSTHALILPFLSSMFPLLTITFFRFLLFFLLLFGLTPPCCFHFSWPTLHAHSTQPLIVLSGLCQSSVPLLSYCLSISSRHPAHDPHKVTSDSRIKSRKENHLSVHI
ncbi:hypothetical protein SCLCIDRAFT_313707 [Scleroderma citrinum Foug A]|uniref:Uncharacterized protein n=1 Tax=Scleroderma citrinum Foug A TaxID=1036808 RepID=A0A0C2ZRB6_9AGAM|nr:hypothetical protein SCLCIDRAFT_313707 [Scleroderma citrinum Foug A]